MKNIIYIILVALILPMNLFLSTRLREKIENKTAKKSDYIYAIIGIFVALIYVVYKFYY